LRPSSQGRKFHLEYNAQLWYHYFKPHWQINNIWLGITAPAFKNGFKKHSIQLQSERWSRCGK